MMIALFVCLHMFTYVIPFINAEARTFHYPDMCVPKQRIYNCSFQISSPYANSCMIYNTEACKKNEFPLWNTEPLHKPRLESNPEFTAIIEPYAFFMDELHKDDPVSAVNISLTSYNKNISGFSIIMNRNVPPKNVCRIVDFRKSLNNDQIPFLFYYDCFYKLREDFWKDILISFRAYPLNIELSYLVYIPRVSGKNSNSSCDWTPLLMIYHEGLARNNIQLKFTNPQNDSKIIFFVITLLDSSDKEIDEIKLNSISKNDMISSEFQFVKSGYYSIQISLILLQESCVVFKSDLFLVGKLKDYSLAILIVMMVVMIIVLCVLAYYLCQRRLASVTSVVKPSLLLVYFHKQLQHEFLVMWAEYLKKHYGVNAYTLYKSGGNPKRWLDDINSKSDIIVFVVSEGLAQVFDEENSFCEEDQDHYWVEQLPEAKALINSLKIGEKKFCKICFPFSDKQHVPESLKDKGGPLFTLLGKVNETEDFLCYIFNCPSTFKLLSKLCCIKHHVINNDDSMQKDIKDLKGKLKTVIENRYDAVVNTDESEGNSESALNKQSDLTFQKHKIMNKSILNVVDEDTNVLAAGSSSFECKIFSQNEGENNSSVCNEVNFMTPSSSIEEYENKNAQYNEQSENISYLNNEFLRYCLKKALNFER